MQKSTFKTVPKARARTYAPKWVPGRVSYNCWAAWGQENLHFAYSLPPPAAASTATASTSSTATAAAAAAAAAANAVAPPAYAACASAKSIACAASKASTATAAASTATASTPSTATAPAAAASAPATSGEQYARWKCAAVFFVEDIERRQADVRDFLFGESDFVAHSSVRRRHIHCRPTSCAARQRERQTCGPQHRQGFAPALSLRSLLRARHGSHTFGQHSNQSMRKPDLGSISFGRPLPNMRLR
jgi:hypothetical protein